MRTTTCPSEQELRAFQLGDLPEALLEEVADHLEGCSQCEGVAQKLDGQLDSIMEFILDTSTMRGGGDTRVLAPTPLPAARLSTPAAERTPASYPFLKPAVNPDEIGRLGPYRVLGLLGAGGMAYVFRAEDVALRRQVALKVMKPELSRDPEGWQRFLREARVLAAIKHDHLVTVYQAGQEQDAVYLAMDLLQGETLESWINRTERIPESEIIRLGKAIASGLAVVHRQGIIHRDIKPANIWLEAPSRQVKILDFGLARTNDDANLTQVGTIMGTPAYMSPEQARAEAVDGRTDLFSLGCVLYCMAGGMKPFRDDNTMAALTALAVDNPRPLEELNPTLSRPLIELIMQLLAKKPAERPASAEAVLERLELIEAGKAVPTTPAPRKSWWGQRGVMAGLAVAVAVLTFFGALMMLSGVFQPGSEQSRPSQQDAKVEVDWPKPNQDGTYLAELKPSEQDKWSNGIPPPPKDKGEKGKGPPGPIPVEYKQKGSPHGIFMHGVPPHLGGGPSSISYAIDKKYMTFYALVTLNDGPPSSETPMTFTVYGDGKQLWQSKPIDSQDDTQRIEISVKDVSVLKIEMECPEGHVKGAHGAWVEPFLAK